MNVGKNSMSQRGNEIFFLNERCGSNVSAGLKVPQYLLFPKGKIFKFKKKKKKKKIGNI